MNLSPFPDNQHKWNPVVLLIFSLLLIKSEESSNEHYLFDGEQNG
ncbi:hypothetical protein SAMN04515674_11093 [Pseudarcicella hirudinis]|uniref:Uncharacterized protein n=1 Tax=Pseudarcicella hirudinis TaxID=1079859 RepID=A0A1I5VVZ5_9BACT|nr:hypothetical protein SAMN04515674_11093 [Pseudarcicella hirudinis]